MVKKLNKKNKKSKLVRSNYSSQQSSEDCPETEITNKRTNRGSFMKEMIDNIENDLSFHKRKKKVDTINAKSYTTIKLIKPKQKQIISEKIIKNFAYPDEDKIDISVLAKGSFELLKRKSKNSEMKYYSTSLFWRTKKGVFKKFFVIQILKEKKTGQLQVINRWGNYPLFGRACKFILINLEEAIKDFHETIDKYRQLGYVELNLKKFNENQIEETETSVASVPEGKISFIDYNVKYTPEGPIILKNLNFEIKSGEKIGVVGRTGSGKSTLLKCLYKIIEGSGKIYIDDVEINKIDEDMIKEKISYISQETELKENSIREYLDPDNEFNDKEILKCINSIGLDKFMKDKKLGYIIRENGYNISSGEKQLLVIAKALLKKTKIVLLDDAISSLDYLTELTFQKKLFQEMKENTLITVSNRIRTLMDYDKILVLSNGEIVEFDSPKNLIGKKGLFYKLYGDSMNE